MKITALRNGKKKKTSQVLRVFFQFKQLPLPEQFCFCILPKQQSKGYVTGCNSKYFYSSTKEFKFNQRRRKFSFPVTRNEAWLMFQRLPISFINMDCLTIRVATWQHQNRLNAKSVLIHRSLYTWKYISSLQEDFF